MSGPEPVTAPAAPGPPGPLRRRVPPWLKWSVRLLVSLTLFWFILRHVGLSRLLGAYAGMNYGLFLLALLVVPPRLLIKTWRWRLLLELAHPDLSFGEAFRTLMIGQSVGMVTPARLGTLSGALALDTARKVRAMGCILIDLFLDVLVVLFAASLAGLLIPKPVLGRPVAALFGLLGIGAAVLLLNSGSALRLLHPLLRGRPLERVQAATNSAAALRPSRLWAAIALSVLIYCCNIGQFYLILASFGPAPVAAVAYSFPLTMLVLTLPISISGLGVREGSAALLLSRFGVSELAAVNASFLLFAITMVVPAVLGPIYLLPGRQRTK